MMTYRKNSGTAYSCPAVLRKDFLFQFFRQLRLRKSSLKSHLLIISPTRIISSHLPTANVNLGAGSTEAAQDTAACPIPIFSSSIYHSIHFLMVSNRLIEIEIMHL